MSRSRFPTFIAGPRTDAPLAPSGGTRAHGTPGQVMVGVWQDHALCRGEGSEYGSVWLYPSKHPRGVVNTAAKLCRGCPVKAECGEQPRPRVGITAGVVYWDAAPTAEIRLCAVCLEALQSRSRFCSEPCRNRYYYEQKLRDNERPVQPLMDWFGDKPVTTVARLCGVAVRTVYRWQTTGWVPGGAVEQLTHRLDVTPADIWGAK